MRFSYLKKQYLRQEKVMCSSIFGPIMDSNNNYHQGDLTDIFRASRGGGGSYGTSSSSTSEFAPHDLSSSSESWHHPHINFSSVMEDPIRVFGDPFSNMRDPFLHDLDLPPPSSYFTASATNTSAMEEASSGFATSAVLSQNLLEDDMRIRPPGCSTNTNNIFSNMIQISPSSINAKLPVSPCDSPPVNMAAATSSSSSLSLSSPRGIEPSSSAVVSAGNMNITVDNAGVQISSPRNPGLKRRKSQAKKVVCIPAPAAANSRPSSGEVVPSDLWAWRKYGQKPIKGSPYPRGYYRCSSSKGCSARKQVERSRTDPNMLVITYTSEHNHPWPTQRNALAGSTRSHQPSKNNTSNNPASKNNNSEAIVQPQNGMSSSSKPREEDHHHHHQSNSDVSKRGNNSVKEEMEEAEKNDELENIMEDSNNGEFSDGLSYKPSMLEGNQSEDFFAELGEIEADPLNLLFTQGFNEQQQRESKALDPFHLFDWPSSGDHNTHTTTSFEEPKRGL